MYGRGMCATDLAYASRVFEQQTAAEKMVQKGDVSARGTMLCGEAKE